MAGGKASISLMFVALKKIIEDKKLRGWWLWAGVEKSNEDEWIPVWVFRFDGCTFIFPSVTCWCEKHDSSTFSPRTYSQRWQATYKTFFSPSSLHTTHSAFEHSWHKSFLLHPSARSLALPSTPADDAIKQRKLEKFSVPRRNDFLLLSLCAESANPYDVDTKRERGCD